MTESIEAHLLAKKHGWGTMVSHRSGETEDAFIADLVVGLGTGQVSTTLSNCYLYIQKLNTLMLIIFQNFKTHTIKFGTN